MSADWRPADEAGLPRVFTGGWVGYCSYETVRYGYLGEQSRSEAACCISCTSMTSAHRILNDTGEPTYTSSK